VRRFSAAFVSLTLSNRRQRNALAVGLGRNKKGDEENNKQLFWLSARR
jgi:hypothetical protein